MVIVMEIVMVISMAMTSRARRGATVNKLNYFCCCYPCCGFLVMGVVIIIVMGIVMVVVLEVLMISVTVVVLIIVIYN